MASSLRRELPQSSASAAARETSPEIKRTVRMPETGKEIVPMRAAFAGRLRLHSQAACPLSTTAGTLLGSGDEAGLRKLLASARSLFQAACPLSTTARR